jgi:thymidylate synthase
MHIYNNYISEMQEQVNRVPYCYPKLFISKKENILDYEFEDLLLINYQTHPQIKMKMNV